ncbi:MAG: ATP-binding cassette domain-containing protein [Erysipelotrichaceae bacterium]|nr:ATP-binding cassette domain-containing protein [Erysipelotrichaceae bacterium]
MLELKHITKKFQDRVILDDISINFPDKGLIGIQGESGCGKSTLLYIIGMLDQNYSGDILYNQEIISDNQQFMKEHISYMMQNKDYISALNVEENIILASQVSSIPYSKAYLEKLLKIFDIHSLIHRYPSQLSGGQLKRVSICKAMLKQSDIVLCDEPTGALHYNQAIEVMQQLQKLSEHSLVIVVSHDKQLLANYCHHILTLEKGKLIGEISCNYTSDIKIIKHRFYSIIYYPIRQLIYQRNKLLFLFLFQWIVILAFFSIVTGMNGILDVINESETSAVDAYMMTIEKKDNSYFETYIQNEMIENISFNYYLDALNFYDGEHQISALISSLPTSTSHIKLSTGRLPANNEEIIISYSLYEELNDTSSLTLKYNNTNKTINIVGVLEKDIFSTNEIYFLTSIINNYPELKDDYTLVVEAKSSYTRELYQYLSEEYIVYSEVIERVDNYQSLLEIAKLVAYVFIGISFFISLLLISIVESIIYFERKHDVAYLLSLGMSKRRLLLLSLLEAVLLGFIMASGGCVFAGLFYYYMNDIFILKDVIGFSLALNKILISEYDLFAVIFIVYMLMCMLSVILPMRRMMQVNKIDVLREE